MGQQVAVERVLDADNYLGETPVWSAAEQALYWVNCEKPAALHRWSPSTGAHESWPMPRRIGGVVLKAGGGAAVVLGDGLYDFDPPTGLSLRAASPLPSYVGLHECACDRQGRFWVGGYDHQFTPADRDHRDAAFCRLDRDALTPVIGGISVANGLAFSPDGGTIYVADSPLRRVNAYDLDLATGDVSHRRTFLQLESSDGFVDGATVDAEGGYWIALAGRGQLRRYNPSGELNQTIELPFSNPTKPAFGGPTLDVLYVTSTKLPITLAGVGGADANGGLFALSPGVRGLEDGLLT